MRKQILDTLDNIPKVTQLVHGRAMIWTRSVWIWSSKLMEAVGSRPAQQQAWVSGW